MHCIYFHIVFRYLYIMLYSSKRLVSHVYHHNITSYINIVHVKIHVYLCFNYAITLPKIRCD